MSGANLSHLGRDIVSSRMSLGYNSILVSRCGIPEYVQVAELATMCKMWNSCILPLAGHTPILERMLMASSTADDCAHGYASSWISNIDYIRRHRREHFVREVRIILDDECQCMLEITMALVSLHISDVLWKGVESLKFVGPGIFTAGAYNCPLIH